jgi:endonuclease YncB( thermonuclease family)
MSCRGCVFRAQSSGSAADKDIGERSAEEDQMLRKLFFFALFTICVLSSAKCEPIAADQVHVVDGDTVRIYHEKPDVRLVGFNAPETRRARCPAERKLGDRATRRLREIIRSETLDFDFVDCSCPAGTEGTFSCNYGRSCGILKANGADVGQTLISEHLAVPFKCGATHCPKTPRPWCEQVNLAR